MHSTPKLAKYQWSCYCQFVLLNNIKLLGQVAFLYSIFMMCCCRCLTIMKQYFYWSQIRDQESEHRPRWCALLFWLCWHWSTSRKQRHLDLLLAMPALTRQLQLSAHRWWHPACQLQQLLQLFSFASVAWQLDGKNAIYRFC